MGLSLELLGLRIRLIYVFGTVLGRMLPRRAFNLDPPLAHALWSFAFGEFRVALYLTKGTEANK